MEAVDLTVILEPFLFLDGPCFWTWDNGMLSLLDEAWLTSFSSESAAAWDIKVPWDNWGRFMMQQGGLELPHYHHSLAAMASANMNLCAANIEKLSVPLEAVYGW